MATLDLKELTGYGLPSMPSVGLPSVGVPSINESLYGQQPLSASMLDLKEYGDKYKFLGDQDYTTRDIGTGQYEILNTDGSVLGIGYKNLYDTAYDYAKDFWGKKVRTTAKQTISQGQQQAKYWIPEITQYGGGDRTYTQKVLLANLIGGNDDGQGAASKDIDPNAYFNSEAELMKDIDPFFQYRPYGKYNLPISDLQYWEQIGQFINGTSDGIMQGASHRDLGGNSIAEPITGKNTLYGSTPIVKGGKVVGYKMDFEPANPDDWGYKNPNYQSRVDPKGDTTSSSSLGRQYNQGWGNYVTPVGDGYGVVNASNVDQLPGWNNGGSDYEYSHQDSGMGGAGSLLGLAASFALGPAGLGLMSAWGAGAAGGAISGLASGGGIKGALKGAALGGIGSGLGGELAGYLGDAAGFNFMGNDFVGPLSMGESLAKSAFGGAMSGGLRGAFSGGDIFESALQGGAAGGIGNLASGLDPTGIPNLDTAIERGLSSAGMTGLFGGDITQSLLGTAANIGSISFGDVTGLSDSTTEGISKAVQQILKSGLTIKQKQDALNKLKQRQQAGLMSRRAA